MSLTGSNLQAAILWMGAKLEALFVICGHNSLYIFKRIWVELWVSEELLNKQEPIYKNRSLKVSFQVTGKQYHCLSVIEHYDHVFKRMKLIFQCQQPTVFVHT